MRLNLARDKYLVRLSPNIAVSGEQLNFAKRRKNLPGSDEHNNWRTGLFSHPRGQTPFINRIAADGTGDRPALPYLYHCHGEVFCGIEILGLWEEI